MKYILLLAVLCLGCSSEAPDKPELGTVSGVVKLNGAPLPNVTVYFKPETGRPSMGKTDDEGRYKAMYKIDEAGVKVGPNKVHLEWGTDDSGPAIPPKFGVRSELTLDVKAGKNEFNIEMESKPGKK